MVHRGRESVLTAPCQPRGRLPAPGRRCVRGELEDGRGGGGERKRGRERTLACPRTRTFWMRYMVSGGANVLVICLLLL
jgi:hypothetical protein